MRKCSIETCWRKMDILYYPTRTPYCIVCAKKLVKDGVLEDSNDVISDWFYGGRHRD